MNQDLKIIKKQYGEKMMHLCRRLFATILDNSPGTLSTILLETYAPNHFLYDDLVAKENRENEFKNYIYRIYQKLDCAKEEYKSPVEDPVTLMKQAGYTLYECKTEKDIQSFKKYYTPGETLCTFGGSRLRSCYVYFAVHDNVDEIKRENFRNPNRQDEYGTSVISIQFTRDDSHTLSIKNRYNHTVSNPDATFANNLDNIIYGLTQSFDDYYGMKQRYINNYFYLPDYVRAYDGKLYKYNYEIDNIYYCPNNIVIDNFKVIEYEKEKYLVADYFIIDLVNKKITSYVQDSFPETIGSIKHIRINKEHNKKIVTITPETGEDIILELNELNQIIGLKNNNVKAIPDYFLADNSYLQNISLDNATTIGNVFLPCNKELATLSLPAVEYIGDNFMPNSNLQAIELPQVLEIGFSFIAHNKHIKSLELPSLVKVGDYFLRESHLLENVSFPKLMIIGAGFMRDNVQLNSISLPNALHIGSHFLFYNNRITNINLPNVETIGRDFMCFNKVVHTVILPKVVKLGPGALLLNKNINQFYAPKLQDRLDNRMLRKFQRRRKLNIIRNLFS